MASSKQRPSDNLDPPGCIQSGPFVAECGPGKYAHCQCKQSARYPFCDGTHRDTDAKPVKVVLDEARTVAWCACSRSSNMPFCDGSHAG